MFLEACDICYPVYLVLIGLLGKSGTIELA